jgi:hypothetical protein
MNLAPHRHARRPLVVLAAAFALVLLLIAGAAAWYVLDARPGPNAAADAVDACIAHSVGPDPTFDPTKYNNARAFCASKLQLTADLVDHDARIASHTVLRVMTRVVLALLVIVIVSGIALTALQLVFAYRLAVAGRAALELTTQIEVAQAAVIRSSVAGVIIIDVGLGFFYLWSRYAYPVIGMQ